jgi:hypothetical protein
MAKKGLSDCALNFVFLWPPRGEDSLISLLLLLLLFLPRLQLRPTDCA